MLVHVGIGKSLVNRTEVVFRKQRRQVPEQLPVSKVADHGYPAGSFLLGRDFEGAWLFHGYAFENPILAHRGDFQTTKEVRA